VSAFQDERDYAEEAYWREFCIPCGDSPCTWDGQPDGFHADEPDDPDSLAARLAAIFLGAGFSEYPNDPRKALAAATMAAIRHTAGPDPAGDDG